MRDKIWRSGPDTRFAFAEQGMELEDARRLVTEYAATLGCGPCFENIERDLARLPQPYVPPEGRLMVLYEQERAAGCVGIRRSDTRFAEMGRLYVKPEYRGKGYGKALAEKALDEARDMGFLGIRLYTLPLMVTAISMYRAMGFQEIQPYTAKRVEGAVYMEMAL